MSQCVGNNKPPDNNGGGDPAVLLIKSDIDVFSPFTSVNTIGKLTYHNRFTYHLHKQIYTGEQKDWPGPTLLFSRLPIPQYIYKSKSLSQERRHSMSVYS